MQQFFKCSEGKVHVLEEGVDPALVPRFPTDAVRISEEEAQELLKPAPLSNEEINAMADANRAVAYRNEADPLFFKFQRGDATREEWLASIEAIKARFPKIE